MSDRIVVGAAGTREGRRAVDWALRRAERLGLGAEAVHIQEGRPAPAQGVEPAQVLVPAGRAFDADAVAPHVTLETATRRGRAVDELVAESRSAAMVVVGAHSRDEATHELRHSPALELALHARCPVAVVPVPRPGHHAGVVVGVDGSERSAAALRLAARDAETLAEELVVVYAWFPANRTASTAADDDSLAERFGAAGRELVERELIPVRSAHPRLAVRVVVEAGIPAVVLARAAAHASELVVGSRGLHGLAELMLGSVSRELLLSPPCPLIVVPSTITTTEPSSSPH